MKRTYSNEPKDDTTSCASGCSGSNASKCFHTPMHLFCVPSAPQQPFPSTRHVSNDIASGTGTGNHSNDISEAERLISEGLHDMSFEERDILYQEVHGVGRLVDEHDPTFVASKLRQLEKDVQQISDKEAYNRAVFLSQTYVHDPDFRLMFLRADQFNTKKAARRMVEHFRHKLEVFGMGRLARPLRWNDLTNQDHKVLLTGCFQMFPDCCDSTGRVLLVNAFKYRGDTIRDDSNLQRAFWYMSMQCFERMSTESERRGHVAIIYPLGSTLSELHREVARESRNLVLDALPGRITGGHLCFDQPVMKTIFTLLLRAAPKDTRVHAKIHAGSHLECQYHLNSFGIRSDTFPLDSDGNMKFDLLYQRLNSLWMYERTRDETEAMERQIRLQRGEGLIRPHENDVLLGRGNIRQSFPGNIRFARLIEANLERYRSIPSADRIGKTTISEQLLVNVHAYGGRFLERSKDHAGLWTEVPDRTAREKISMAFRNRARRFNNSD